MQIDSYWRGLTREQPASPAKTEKEEALMTKVKRPEVQKICMLCHPNNKSKNLSHGYCRYHELLTLAGNELATEEELQELANML